MLSMRCIAIGRERVQAICAMPLLRKRTRIANVAHEVFRVCFRCCRPLLSSAVVSSFVVLLDRLSNTHNICASHVCDNTAVEKTHSHLVGVVAAAFSDSSRLVRSRT